MTYSFIDERLKQGKTIILDGGIGGELQKVGAKIQELVGKIPPKKLIWENRRKVRARLHCFALSAKTLMAPVVAPWKSDALH